VVCSSVLPISVWFLERGEFLPWFLLRPVDVSLFHGIWRLDVLSAIGLKLSQKRTGAKVCLFVVWICRLEWFIWESNSRCNGNVNMSSNLFLLGESSYHAPQFPLLRIFFSGKRSSLSIFIILLTVSCVFRTQDPAFGRLNRVKHCQCL
jgi:hypothetical protein